jgi:hypothetical protein
MEHKSGNQKAKGKSQKLKVGFGRLRHFIKEKIKRKNKVPPFCLVRFAF